MQNLIEAIEQWAEVRGIFAHSDPKTQMLKCVSEVGELADAVAVRDADDIIDGIGDVLVTLILLARMEGLTLEFCLESALAEISGRSGRMVNGVFVKSSDLVDGQQSECDRLRAELSAERDRWSAQMRNVLGHTAHLPACDRELLEGLLQNIRRIADWALKSSDLGEDR